MPINKATIMPRGPSLGHVRKPLTCKPRFLILLTHTILGMLFFFPPRLQVSMLPENDRWNETRSQLLAQMDVSMGGRVAEEIMFGQDYITTGSQRFLDVRLTRSFCPTAFVSGF